MILYYVHRNPVVQSMQKMGVYIESRDFTRIWSDFSFIGNFEITGDKLYNQANPLENGFKTFEDALDYIIEFRHFSKEIEDEIQKYSQKPKNYAQLLDEIERLNEELTDLREGLSQIALGQFTPRGCVTIAEQTLDKSLNKVSAERIKDNVYQCYQDEFQRLTQLVAKYESGIKTEGIVRMRNGDRTIVVHFETPIKDFQKVDLLIYPKNPVDTDH